MENYVWEFNWLFIFDSGGLEVNVGYLFCLDFYLVMIG